MAKKNWLREILDDAQRKIDAMPEWALSPDYRRQVQELEAERIRNLMLDTVRQVKAGTFKSKFAKKGPQKP